MKHATKEVSSSVPAFETSASPSVENEVTEYVIYDHPQPEQIAPDLDVEKETAVNNNKKAKAIKPSKNRITLEQRLAVKFLTAVYDRTDVPRHEDIDINDYVRFFAKKVCSIKDNIAPTHEDIDKIVKLNTVKHSANPDFVEKLQRAGDRLHEYLEFAERNYLPHSMRVKP